MFLQDNRTPEQELLNRFMDAAVKVRETLSFKVTVGARRQRIRCCIRQNGGHFEGKQSDNYCHFVMFVNKSLFSEIQIYIYL